MKFAFHSIFRPDVDLKTKCGRNFIKTVPFHNIVHFIQGENIVTHFDFDCGFTFHREAPIKVGQIMRERKDISRSCEKPKCIPGSDQRNFSIDEQHTSNIFLNPYNLWNHDPLAFLSLKHTTDREPLSNQYPRTTTHQPKTDLYLLFSSMRPLDSKKKGLRVNFAFFQKNLYQKNEWTKQLLRLKNWVIFGNPEPWLEFHRLWLNCGFLQV